MASVMAIVSKAQFEGLSRAAGGLKVGDVAALDRYNSSHKGLTPLAEGGDLFLATVRPGDVLWLVAVLEVPTFDGERWRAEENRAAIVDLGPIKSKLRFSTGKGITAGPGKLAMSMQTPRQLTDADVQLLWQQARGAGAPAPKTKAPKAKSGPSPKSKKKRTPESKAPAEPPEKAPGAGKSKVAKKKRAVAKKGKSAKAKGISQSLEQATALARDGDVAGALQAVVAAWRERRAPELGDLAEKLAEQLPAETTAHYSADIKAAGDATFARLAQQWKAKSLADSESNLAALATRGDHPHTGLVLEAIFREPPYTSNSSRDFWQAACERLGQSEDPRLLSLEGALDDWGMRQVMKDRVANMFNPAFEALKQRLGEVVPALEPAERAVADKLVATARKASGAGDADVVEGLYQAVYDDPDNDDPRHILADYLVERGDPRGELIALQLQPKLKPAERKRMKELLKAHGREWLGAIEPAIGKFEYRRGFVAEVNLFWRSKKSIEELVTHPAWRTVEKVTPAYSMSNEARETPWLHPSWTALKDVHLGNWDNQIIAVCESKQPWSLKTLRVSPYREEARQALRVTKALPKLERLEIQHYFQEEMLSWPLIEQVKELRIFAQNSDPLATLYAWAWHQSNLRLFELGSHLGALRFERDEHGGLTRCKLFTHVKVHKVVIQRMAEGFAKLPVDALTEFSIEKSKSRLDDEQLKLFESAAARQKRLASMTVYGETVELKGKPGKKPWAGPKPPRLSGGTSHSAKRPASKKKATARA